jgi:putative ABC transport system permease protein
MRDWKEEVRVRLTSANLAPERTAEIVEELAQHLRDRCEELQLRGHTVESAEEAVLAEINDGSLVKELSRIESRYSAPVGLGEESRGGGFLASIWQDVRYGMRVLRLNPSFTVVCVLSLALGIGANTAIFQLINAVRMRNLPVADPDSLAIVRIIDMKFRQGRATGRYPELTFPMWREIQQRQQGFSAIAAWGPASFNLTNGGQVRYARGMWVSGEFFNVLQQPPLLGRLFGASDDVPGCGGGSAVISHAFWQREFGGDKNVIGRKFTLDSHPFEVIGVTPPKFYGVEVGRSYDVAVPLCTEPLFNGENALTPMRHGWWLASIGRLKPGWTLQKATAHLQSISVPIMEATTPTVYSPDSVKKYMGYRLGAVAGGNGFSRLRKEYETPLWLLLAVSGVVLLIACANLANLMLARATAREREVAVRLAIGASRRRIVRQMLSESLLLAAMGAAGGVAVAQWFSRSLVAFLGSDDSPLFVDLGLDWHVFAFTAAVAVAACLLFGLTPAIRATRTLPGATMKAGSRGMTDGRERFGVRRALVVLQVALSLVLVVGALLFARSLRNLTSLDPGFRQDGVLMASLDMRKANIPKDARAAMNARIMERVRAIPGVVAVAQAFMTPVGGSFWNNRILIGGAIQKPAVNFNSVGPGYFRTLGIRLASGRDFDGRDTPESPKVAIVTEAFVRTYLGGSDPIGQSFQIEEGVGQPRPFYEIVGVARDTKYTDLREPFAPLAHIAATQETEPDERLRLVIRAETAMTAVTPALTREITGVNPAIAVQYQTMKTQVQQSLVRERLMATLSGFFGGLAVLIATIGLYGVMSYMVARRRIEIGVRMALGADRGRVVRMIVREAAVLLAAGLVIGAVLSVFAARTADTFLLEC